MILGKQLNIDSVLKDYPYNKIERPAFTDRGGQSGLAMGGRFANMEELHNECCAYDVYIHSLHEMKGESGTNGLWAVYACRQKEKTAAKSTGLATYLRR